MDTKKRVRAGLLKTGVRVGFPLWPFFSNDSWTEGKARRWAALRLLLVPANRLILEAPPKGFQMKIPVVVLLASWASVGLAADDRTH